MIANPAPDRALQGTAQVLHLLNEVLQIQFVVPTGAQKLCLTLAPDVEILLVQLSRVGSICVAIIGSSDDPSSTR